MKHFWVFMIYAFLGLLMKDENLASATTLDVHTIVKNLQAELQHMEEWLKSLRKSKDETQIEMETWNNTYMNVVLPELRLEAKRNGSAVEEEYERETKKQEFKEVEEKGKLYGSQIATNWFRHIRKWAKESPNKKNHILFSIVRQRERFERRLPNFKSNYEGPMKALIAKERELEKPIEGMTRDEFISKVEVARKRLAKSVKRVLENQFHESYRRCLSRGSGIKQIRIREVGLKHYFSRSFNGGSVAAIHDHSNNKYTIGMGEMIGVINCVEFRTRHNDYRLRKPAPSKKPDTPVFIEFPQVPPEVLKKRSVDEQITEMREWFKAFKEQKHDVRDYRKYFKPVLCYMEGMWTPTSNDAKIDEPFDSDRHFIDAKNRFDLQEKIRFTSFTGTKSALENLAFLPTKIDGYKEGLPVISQWNYGIYCHPLTFKDGESLPVNKFKVKYDLSGQMFRGTSDKDYVKSRNARFSLESLNYKGEEIDEPLDYTLMDKLMEQIPGKDNYAADLTYKDGDKTLYSADPEKENTVLNVGYYHRVYKKKDENGVLKTFSRAFNDRVWMAHTTNSKVSETVLNYENGTEAKKLRVSYAIPLEVIYLTPLQRWNPHNIPYNPDRNDREGKGTGTEKDPYKQMVEFIYYNTPVDFFNSDVTQGDAADTAKNFVWALSKTTNSPVKVTPSGTYIVMNHIENVGKIRTRYPIIPIHLEGNLSYKYFEAAKEKYDIKNANSRMITFITSPSHSEKTLAHTHTFEMTSTEYWRILRNGWTLEFNTETANAHEHVFKVKRKDRDFQNPQFIISVCDHKPSKNGLVCFDHHSENLVIVRPPS